MTSPPLSPFRSTHVFLGYFAFLRQSFQVLIQQLYLNLKKERFESCYLIYIVSILPYMGTSFSSQCLTKQL